MIMKGIFFTLALLLPFFAQAQSEKLEIGDELPHITGTTIDGLDIYLDEWKGRVVVLEFWATWCSPCLSGLKHLHELKAQLGGDLEIVAISRETATRQKRFADYTQYPFWFIEHRPLFDTFFPHRVIPHSVVVGPDGQIAAITAPGNITEATIRTLLQKKSVTLPLKNDSPWDPGTLIFERDSLVVSAFEIQPDRPDAPTFSRTYNEPPFARRRTTMVNFRIPDLYRHALQTTVYRMDIPEEGDEQYCVDIVVPPDQEEQLYMHMLDSLDQYFGWQVDTVVQEVDVWVLSQAAAGVQLAFAKKPGLTSASGSGFVNSGAPLAAFANYLESFGLAGKPVLNEAEMGEQLFDINFTFDPENPATFKESLGKMGLQVQPERRQVMIYRVQPSQ